MLGKTNASVGGKVNNQDLYVTDNGTYTAGDGFSGLGVVEVNVPKGEQVTAINKTGSTIFTGQKVWLSENVQTAGSSYKFAGVNERSYLSRSGNFAYANNKTYSITNESATSVGSISAGDGSIKYMADNSVFANRGRVDDVAQYSLPTTNYPFGDDYFGFDGAFNKINMADGSIIQSWTLGSGATYVLGSDTCKVGNYFYRLTHNSSYMMKVTLNDDGTATGVRYNFSNVDSNSRYPIGVTADNKYIIADSSINNLDSSGYLRIIEVIDEDNFKELPQSEMPAELQKYFSIAKGYFVFNPYTGILTAVDSTSIDYVVMKYENSEWKTLSVTLDLPEDITSFTSGLMLSDDLSRASISYKATQYGSYAYPHIHNITSTSGYSVVPYRFYNITENSQTGYAGNDVEPDGEVIVGIGSVPSVDTGGSGGNSGSYEIDYDLVTVVNDFGTLEFSANENGNNTVLSGFDTSSGFWFNAAPMFGQDHSLEYQFKFRIEDIHIAALAETVALGNFQENPFANKIRFGTTEWPLDGSTHLTLGLYGANGRIAYIVFENTSQILGQWITASLKVNEEGKWQFYTDTPLDVNDPSTEDAEYLSIPINYYLIFANNYGRTPAISVDLEGTGFKQNGEWVYRAVKPI